MHNLYQFPVYSDTCTRRAGVLTGAVWGAYGRGGAAYGHGARGHNRTGRGRGRAWAASSGLRGGARVADILKCSLTVGEPLHGARGRGATFYQARRYKGKLRYFNVLKWEENAKNPPTLSGKRAFFAKSGRKYHVSPPTFSEIIVNFPH